MLLGGDEMGRTQGGNNNAYCQDNEVSWLDWKNVDGDLLAFTARLIAFRREHPVFRRDGDDIYLTVPVSATEAALGAKIEVPTIDGRALLKIPPGTQSGQKLRLREKGVPSATKEGVRGDEIVEITDALGDTSLPTGEKFSVFDGPVTGLRYGGVAFAAPDRAAAPQGVP